MNNTPCSFEEKMVRALSENRWNEELEQHINQCDSCLDTYLAASFMNTVSSKIKIPDTLPTADMLFAQASARKEANREELIVQPLKVMNWIFSIIGTVMTLTALYLSKGMLSELFDGVTFNVDTSRFTQVFDVSQWGITWLGVGISAIILAIFTAIIVFVDYKEDFSDPHPKHIHLHTL